MTSAGIGANTSLSGANQGQRANIFLAQKNTDLERYSAKRNSKNLKFYFFKQASFIY